MFLAGICKLIKKKKKKKEHHPKSVTFIRTFDMCCGNFKLINRLFPSLATGILLLVMFFRNKERVGTWDKCLFRRTDREIRGKKKKEKDRHTGTEAGRKEK